MSYESIIENVPADKRHIADAYLQGLAEGVGIAQPKESDKQPKDNSQGFDFGDPSVWNAPLYQH